MSRSSVRQHTAVVAVVLLLTSTVGAGVTAAAAGGTQASALDDGAPANDAAVERRLAEARGDETTVDRSGATAAISGDPTAQVGWFDNVNITDATGNHVADGDGDGDDQVYDGTPVNMEFKAPNWDSVSSYYVDTDGDGTNETSTAGYIRRDTDNDGVREPYLPGNTTYAYDHESADAASDDPGNFSDPYEFTVYTVYERPSDSPTGDQTVSRTFRVGVVNRPPDIVGVYQTDRDDWDRDVRIRAIERDDADGTEMEYAFDTDFDQDISDESWQTSNETTLSASCSSRCIRDVKIGVRDDLNETSGATATATVSVSFDEDDLPNYRDYGFNDSHPMSYQSLPNLPSDYNGLDLREVHRVFAGDNDYPSASPTGRVENLSDPLVSTSNLVRRDSLSYDDGSWRPSPATMEWNRENVDDAGGSEVPTTDLNDEDTVHLPNGPGANPNTEDYDDGGDPVVEDAYFQVHSISPSTRMYYDAPDESDHLMPYEGTIQIVGDYMLADGEGTGPGGERIGEGDPLFTEGNCYYGDYPDEFCDHDTEIEIEEQTLTYRVFAEPQTGPGGTGSGSGRYILLNRTVDVESGENIAQSVVYNTTAWVDEESAGPTIAQDDGDWSEERSISTNGRDQNASTMRLEGPVELDLEVTMDVAMRHDYDATYCDNGDRDAVYDSDGNFSHYDYDCLDWEYDDEDEPYNKWRNATETYTVDDVWDGREFEVYGVEEDDLWYRTRQPSLDDVARPVIDVEHGMPRYWSGIHYEWGSSGSGSSSIVTFDSGGEAVPDTQVRGSYTYYSSRREKWDTLEMREHDGSGGTTQQTVYSPIRPAVTQAVPSNRTINYTGVTERDRGTAQINESAMEYNTLDKPELSQVDYDYNARYEINHSNRGFNLFGIGADNTYQQSTNITHRVSVPQVDNPPAHVYGPYPHTTDSGHATDTIRVADPNLTISLLDNPADGPPEVQVSIDLDGESIGPSGSLGTVSSRGATLELNNESVAAETPVQLDSSSRTSVLLEYQPTSNWRTEDDGVVAISASETARYQPGTALPAALLNQLFTLLASLTFAYIVARFAYDGIRKNGRY